MATSFVPWNWKILQENFLEPYHLTYLHADSHDFAPASATTFLPFDVGDQAIIRHGGFREIDGSLMATGWGKPALFAAVILLHQNRRTPSASAVRRFVHLNSGPAESIGAKSGEIEISETIRI